MLTIEEAIRQRRSIRSFRPDPIPDDVLCKVLEAARLAPSGSNRQPWRFLVIKDAAMRKEVRRLGWDQKFLEEPPAVIFCLADLKAYSVDSGKRRRREFVEYGVMETLSGRFADPKFMAEMDTRPEPVRDSVILPAVANTYIAIEHMVLMAAALGLGTCWVGAFEGKELMRLFGLPDNLLPVALLPIGYPTRVPPPRPRLSMAEIMVSEGAGNSG